MDCRSAATDVHLWAERFDLDTGNLMVLQDEVTARIANALGVELIGRRLVNLVYLC
jgi:TolB-like protein